MMGVERSFPDERPPEMQKAREHLLGFLEKAEINPSQTIIGGFSQGAMMSVDLCLSVPQNFLSLLILSGTLIAKNDWKSLLETKQEQRFFQSHGDNDPLLPFAHAEKLYNLLRQNQFAGDFHQFKGGHEIPLAVLEQLKAHLDSL